MVTGTSLAVYQNVPDSLAFIRENGETLAKSRMFGCKDEAQGRALMLISMTEMIPILRLRQMYHIVDGELVMRAEYARASFRALGGQYWWINTGEDGVAAIFRVKYRENDMEVRYSIEDAKKEGLVRAGSRWLKAPGDMLRARVGTKAIRMVCPEVLAGFATDEEMIAISGSDLNASDIIDGEFRVVPKNSADEPPVEVAAESKPSSRRKATTSEPAKPSAASESAKPATVSDDDLKPCSPELAAKVKALFQTAEVSVDEVTKVLQKRGVNAVRSLTTGQCNELVENLQKRIAKNKAAAEAAADVPFATNDAPDAPINAIGDAHSAFTWEPCTPEQEQRAKSLLKEITARDSTLGGKLTGELKVHLAKLGKSKISDLSIQACDVLIGALTASNLQSFFLVTADAKEAAAKN